MMPCQFCTAPAELVACAWLVPKFVIDNSASLEVGDRIKSFHGRGGAMRVMSIRPGRGTALTLVVRANGGAPVDLGTYTDYAIQVERPRPCGVLVCEAHIRMVSAETGYCFSHWNAWEEIA